MCLFSILFSVVYRLSSASISVSETIHDSQDRIYFTKELSWVRGMDIIHYWIVLADRIIFNARLNFLLFDVDSRRYIRGNFDDRLRRFN